MAVGQAGIDVSITQDAGEIYALMGDRLYPAISAAAIVQYGLAAVVVAALAALFPARQAAKREPAESLHYV
jgi:ABC-type antimicrobial peptide transport system permease subunit